MIVQCNNCHLNHEFSGRPPGTQIICRCDAVLQVPELDDNTHALTCPQCGGQASKDLSRCGHCDSALATVRCAGCYGLAFDGHAHCFHCGGSMESPAVVVHETGRKTLPCPRCRSDLTTEVVENTLVDGCRNCGGIWLDLAAFERIRAEREKFSDFVQELNISAKKDTGSMATDNDQSYVRCPMCDHFMLRRNFARRSNIIIDVCAAHGIWFDGGELARVLAYQQSTNATMALRADQEQKTTVTVVSYPRSTGRSHLGGGISAVLSALVLWWS